MDLKFVKKYSKYESSFKPKVLGNWQVPKLNISRPKSKKGNTKAIADERGHLLPNIKRSNGNPWGNYIDTWHLPKKIDKKTAYQINGLIQNTQTSGYNQYNESHATQNPEEAPNNEEENNKENDETNSMPQPYVPGDFTERKYQHPSYEELAANRFPSAKPLPNGFPRTREDFSRHTEPERNLTKEVNDFYDTHKQMLQAEPPEKPSEPKKERFLSPLINAISNFTMAKKLHRENLEHYPLPDTLTDAMYRKMLLERQSKGEEDVHYATGIGWKGYPGYGPTRCTKLKIFRPKTSISPKDEPVSSFDRKWRFIRQAKVSPMDLAICWDLKPQDPNDEPEKAKHVDGSNGSAAPAVFNLVHSPKQEEAEHKCDGVHVCGPVFDHSDKGNEDKEYFFHRSKKAPRSAAGSSSCSDQSKRRAKSALGDGEKLSSCSKESFISAKSRAKSASNSNDIEGRIPEISKEVIDKNMYRSTPNLSECGGKYCKKYAKMGCKSCVACEMKDIRPVEKRPKSEYKMAFKAGVPQQKTVSKPSCNLKVPKPKVPYMVKNYVIDSLGGPFCLQKKKRDDYPEHWRLATVYQHSYKPIYARKRPLMHTVFK
ncbi:unnamed protein product [Phyllotreta striolata]|uniref:Cilia- and flagella-associated protein 126 n=1 Tax=Phyllotreta striolata TaxID=444603 RepID=A0A9N9TTK6_PHYSR|nr:unnamed protein product [Phyllotreta striolata]